MAEKERLDKALPCRICYANHPIVSPSRLRLAANRHEKDEEFESLFKL
ncbi:MAG TPA: hypothetical protein PKN28_04935 [Clostridiales bacterium]|nr:hypothetical protein [Clostridiales bacterium]